MNTRDPRAIGWTATHRLLISLVTAVVVLLPLRLPAAAVPSPVVTSVIPAAPVLTAAAVGGMIKLFWTDPTPATASAPPGNPADEQGFTIQRATNSVFAAKLTIFLVPANVTTMTDATTDPHTTYRYRVFACNAAGHSPMSNIVALSSAITTPGAPTGVTATADKAQATVTFKAPMAMGGSLITGYTVTSNPPGGVDRDAGTPARSHLVTGLVNGTAYSFIVRATNASGSGPASAASAAVTPAMLSEAPIAGTAVRGNAFTAQTASTGSGTRPAIVLTAGAP